jgi:hypothetical protein
LAGTRAGPDDPSTLWGGEGAGEGGRVWTRITIPRSVVGESGADGSMVCRRAGVGEGELMGGTQTGPGDPPALGGGEGAGAGGWTRAGPDSPSALCC